MPRLLMATFLLVIPACSVTRNVNPTTEEVSGLVTTAANPWSEATREILVPACGSCHRPGLPTSKPDALLVFDLEEREQWHARLDTERLRALERRVRGSDSIVEADKETVGAFVAFEIEGDLAP